MPGLLWLEWWRCPSGYRICEPEPDFFDSEEDQEVDEGDFFLEVEDDETVSYRPMEEFPGLFMEFAETEQTPDGVKGFADKFGLLWETPARQLEDEMTIYDWCKYIRRMRNAVDMWADQRKRGSIGDLIEAISERPFAQAAIYLKGVDDPMRGGLYFKPANLHDGMWIQFIAAVGQNAQLRRCAQCPSWIVFGIGTGRRESAKFCTSACRRAAWKEEKESRK